MMKATKPIGLDDNFREVFPGDEVQDADGRSFTITPAGWAKPLDGGSEVAFKRLKKPVLVRQASKFAEGPDGKAGPAPGPVKAVPRSTPPANFLPERPAAAPVKAQPRTAPTTESTKPGDRGKGKGKPNQSGWSKISNICRNVGIPGQGITGYLRDHGFEVYRAEGTSCVKVEDREKVVAFLRDNPPPVGLPKTSSYDGAVRRIKAEVAAPDSCTVREAGDQMLVDELRARGWIVTCTKTQSL